jgi:hypothetical protein
MRHVRPRFAAAISEVVPSSRKPLSRGSPRLGFRIHGSSLKTELANEQAGGGGTQFLYFGLCFANLEPCNYRGRAV